MFAVARNAISRAPDLADLSGASLEIILRQLGAKIATPASAADMDVFIIGDTAREKDWPNGTTSSKCACAPACVSANRD